MRVNVDKVLERDQKLSELDDRAGWCGLAMKVVHLDVVNYYRPR